MNRLHWIWPFFKWGNESWERLPDISRSLGRQGAELGPSTAPGYASFLPDHLAHQRSHPDLVSSPAPRLKFIEHTLLRGASPGGLEVKSPPAMQEMQGDAVSILGWEEIHWGGKWCNRLQYSLPGKLHGQRILACCSPCGYKESTRLSDWAHMYVHWLYSLWIRYYRSLTWFEFSFLERKISSRQNPISST